jgi:hypothetical protein
VPVLREEGAGFPDRVADGGPADVAEGGGEDVQGAQPPLVEDGEHDAFAVADLLREDPTAEARLGEAVARGEPWAVTFALKTVGKDRGYVEKVEHGGLGRQEKVIVEVVYSDEALRPGPSPGVIVTEAPAALPDVDDGGAEDVADADVFEVPSGAFRNGRPS